MKPIMHHANVDVQNIPILQLVKIRNPVANDLVDRGTAGSREIVVVERRGVAVTFHAGFVDDAVDFKGCDADFCGFLGFIQDFSAELGIKKGWSLTQEPSTSLKPTRQTFRIF